MRILIASADYTPDGGGIGAYAHGLWQGLGLAGCTARVLSRYTPARHDSPGEHMLPIAGGGSPRRNLDALCGWYLALKRELCRQAYDWAVVPTWDPVALAATLPMFRRALPCRIAVVFHGADVAGAQGRKARLLRYVMRSADRLVANSSYTRELIGRRFGADAGTVRPAIGSDDLDLPGAAPGGQHAVVSVGRLVRRKGHALVLGAIARLADEFPQISYTVVGDGPERENLDTLAGSLGIRGRVRILGHVSVAEKRRQLLSAGVFALPVLTDESDPEGFGIAYLEAGAARLPVIATRTGGVAECVREGETGLFCDASAAGVADALRRLFENRELRATLAQGGRRLAETSVWSNRALDLLEVLEGGPVEGRTLESPQ